MGRVHCLSIFKSFVVGSVSDGEGVVAVLFVNVAGFISWNASLLTEVLMTLMILVRKLRSAFFCSVFVFEKNNPPFFLFQGFTHRILDNSMQ